MNKGMVGLGIACLVLSWAGPYSILIYNFVPSGFAYTVVSISLGFVLVGIGLFVVEYRRSLRALRPSAN